jgi:hypothetical protein
MWYEVKTAADEWDVRTHVLGNGHTEISCRQVQYLEEFAPATLEDLETVERRRELEHEERARANALRAARRAKTRVRRLVKSMGLDALLTLTYRANQDDRALCLKHLKEFVRRIRRVLPGFAYVAALEQQQRGAWHVHLAVHALPRALDWAGVKVKSYSVVRAIWRSVTGELGGNIDQARRKRASQSRPAKLAAYLSKYMLKAYEDGDDWSNRFSASSHQLPPAVRVRLQGAALRDVIALVYCDALGGGVQSSPWLSPYGDSFFLVLEGLSGGGTAAP